MLKILAILFGLSMIVIGILGFLPDYAPNGKLLDLFSVNPVHNVIHLATGVIALLCGLSSSFASKTFFILFGLLYLGFGIYGLYTGEDLLFGLIAINQADNFLHLGIGAISLLFGLFLKSGR